MFDYTDTGHKEDYLLQKKERKKYAELVKALVRDKYDEAKSI